MRDYNEPIIIRRRSGTSSDDPFIMIDETHTVSNGIAMLTEIPDVFSRVKVTSSDGEVWYEIQKGVPKENEYIVDYINKIVTFNYLVHNVQLSFSYRGTGLHYLPTSMIYTEENNGVVTETLKQLVDTLKEVGDIATETKEEIVLDENTRKSNETNRTSNENTRVTNENQRKANETLRTSDEEKRKSNEETRKVDESSRASEEITRKSNEETRKSNEVTRQQNEMLRQSSSTAAITNAVTATTNANNLVNSIVHKGTYSTSTAYIPRNIVSYQGSSFMNILASTNNLPTNTTYWQLLSSQGIQGIQGIQGVKGDKGDTGTSFTWRGEYSPSTAYVANNVTSLNGNTYIALQNTTGNSPTNTTFWSIFTKKGLDGSGSVNSVNGKSGDITLTALDVGAETAEGSQAKVDTHAGNTNLHVTTADKNTWNAKSNFSGSYADLTNKPSIPTKTSQITNDSGFITSSPVSSVNGKTGAVQLIATDVGAISTETFNTHKSDYISHTGYATTTGSVNTYIATLSPALSAYAEGVSLRLKINVDNTGASTINVNGLGAKPIKKTNGNDVSSGNFKAGSIYTFSYNGTSFILQGEGGGLSDSDRGTMVTAINNILNC